ncbi:hypothetical protein ACG0Z6_01100 [Roseateles sp. BYS180W]|uniref:Uncharacterized protein n=1 Tax=Roseateles rivi TaxID=3299028 RepID=A0ABW7FRA5_9BURK
MSKPLPYANDPQSSPSTGEERADTAASTQVAANASLPCEDAAQACWYLCRSLGLARQQRSETTDLGFLFDLLGAMADLPPDLSVDEVSAAGTDAAHLHQLCEQLQSARSRVEAVWDEQSDRDNPAPPAQAPRSLH